MVTTVQQVIVATPTDTQTVTVADSCAYWWLSGGIPSANCLIAYQPVGADDYADSKINLADPGTYDATNGINFPTWDVDTGWLFTASSSQYLLTGGARSDTKPFSIVAYINHTGSGYRTIVGPVNAGGFQFRVMGDGTNRSQLIKSAVTNIANSTTGVGADDVVAATYSAAGAYVFYLNGGSDGSGTNDQTFTNSDLRVGVNSNGEYFDGYIYALSIYDIVLTAEQVDAVTDAMLAL